MKITIFKLGSLEHKIFPTEAAINKLKDILLNHEAGESIDIIWSPDLAVEQVEPDSLEGMFIRSERADGKEVLIPVCKQTINTSSTTQSLENRVANLEYSLEKLNSSVSYLYNHEER